jgi:hypothetical protein
MAKIVRSDSAPEDAKILTTAQDSYEVPFETDDPVVIDNVRVHPWFDVEADLEPVVAPPSTATTLPAEEDAFSRINSKADKVGIDGPPTHKIAPVALDAELDQKEPKTVGTVAVTTAAADEADPVVVADSGSNAKPASTKKESK